MAAREPDSRGTAGTSGRDLAFWFLAAATVWMPAGRRDWGRAMVAELGQIPGRRARWQFALGAARVALAPPRASGPPRLAPVVLAAGACSSAALAIYTVRRFPQPAGDHDHRYALICPLLAVLLAGYTGLAFLLARRLPRGHRSAHRGLAAATAMAACWTAGFLLHEQAGLPATGWAWPAAATAPLAAAALATRHRGQINDGLLTGVWASLFGGLALFIVTMATTCGSINWYAHDPQTIADARLHALPATAWIAGDNLGGATFMLILLPVLVLISAAIGSVLSRNLRRLPGAGGSAIPSPASRT